MSDRKFTKDQFDKIYVIIAENTHPISVKHFDVITQMLKEIEKVVFNNDPYR